MDVMLGSLCFDLVVERIGGRFIKVAQIQCICNVPFNEEGVLDQDVAVKIDSQTVASGRWALLDTVNGTSEIISAEHIPGFTGTNVALILVVKYSGKTNSQEGTVACNGKISGFTFENLALSPAVEDCDLPDNHIWKIKNRINLIKQELVASHVHSGERDCGTFLKPTPPAPFRGTPAKRRFPVRR